MPTLDSLLFSFVGNLLTGSVMLICLVILFYRNATLDAESVLFQIDTFE